METAKHWNSYCASIVLMLITVFVVVPITVVNASSGPILWIDLVVAGLLFALSIYFALKSGFVSSSGLSRFDNLLKY